MHDGVHEGVVCVQAGQGAGMLSVAVPPALSARGRFPAADATFDGFGYTYSNLCNLCAPVFAGCSPCICSGMTHSHMHTFVQDALVAQVHVLMLMGSELLLSSILRYGGGLNWPRLQMLLDKRQAGKV